VLSQSERTRPQIEWRSALAFTVHTASFEMAGRPRGGSTPSAWMTVFYLLLIFIAPLALVGQVSAQVENEQEPMAAKDLGTVIGIDLGTTYSCVGVMQNGKVEILANDQGNRITPSYVAFNDEERLVGDAAKNQYASNPKRTVYDIKRMIGRKWADKDVQADQKHFPFTVKNKDGRPVVSVEVAGSDRIFSPEEISAMVLGKMRDVAEAYLGKKVENAVVTGEMIPW